MIDSSLAQKSSDEELVKLTLADQDYFVFLVTRYQTKLVTYIKRISNASQEEAEDVLQEVFLKVYLNLNDFDGDLKFSSWIYRITHNQVISNFRKLKARPEGYLIDLDDSGIKRLLGDVNIIDEMDQRILKQGITQILEGLSEKYREILVLKFLEEKSYQEISDIIKKPQGTVASLMNKAKQEFRGELLKQKIKL